MDEEIQYWCLNGVNAFQGREFKGVGYVKLVRFANLDDDNTIPLNPFGEPIFTPNNDIPPIHQETGYFMAFRRRNIDGALWEFAKILNIVRGQSLMIKGRYDPLELELVFDLE